MGRRGEPVEEFLKQPYRRAERGASALHLGDGKIVERGFLHLRVVAHAVGFVERKGGGVVVALMQIALTDKEQSALTHGVVAVCGAGEQSDGAVILAAVESLNAKHVGCRRERSLGSVDVGLQIGESLSRLPLLPERFALDAVDFGDEFRFSQRLRVGQQDLGSLFRLGVVAAQEIDLGGIEVGHRAGHPMASYGVEIFKSSGIVAFRVGDIALVEAGGVGISGRGGKRLINSLSLLEFREFEHTEAAAVIEVVGHGVAQT